MKQYSNVLNGRPIDTQASLLFYSGHKMLFFLQTLLITFIPSRLTQLKMAYASYQKPFSHQEKRSLVRCEVLMVTFFRVKWVISEFLYSGARRMYCNIYPSRSEKGKQGEGEMMWDINRFLYPVDCLFFSIRKCQEVIPRYSTLVFVDESYFSNHIC